MEKGACYNCSASGVHVDTTIPLTTGGNTGWFATKQQGAGAVLLSGQLTILLSARVSLR